MELIQSGPKPLEIMYGGAAGGGKSYAIRMVLVNYCLQFAGARAVLFRRTYKELEDTHISMLLQEIPSYIASYHVGAHEFRFSNGSVLMLRFCDKEEDIYSYDTFEADIMAFDELTAFTSLQYDYLSTRCRSTKKWWPGRILLSATNPGNTGHEWVMQRFIETPPNGSGGAPYQIVTAPDDEGGMKRVFIPAKFNDNPALARNDPDYIKGLKRLPNELYRAKALGDWSIFSGQFFSRWRTNIHVVKQFSIPDGWSRYISVDWGIASPHSVHWAARPPGTSTLYVYREQYGKDIPTAEQARLARERTLASGEKIEFVVADPSMWAKERTAHGDYMQSNSAYWEAAFSGICEVVKGNNERLMGASLMREMLDWQGVEELDGSVNLISPPRLFFMESCPNAIRTIPRLIHSKLNPEDVDTSQEDHCYDDIRYLVRALFQAPVQPKAKRYVIDAGGAIRVVAA